MSIMDFIEIISVKMYLMLELWNFWLTNFFFFFCFEKVSHEQADTKTDHTKVLLVIFSNFLPSYYN